MKPDRLQLFLEEGDVEGPVDLLLLSCFLGVAEVISWDVLAGELIN